LTYSDKDYLGPFSVGYKTSSSLFSADQDIDFVGTTGVLNFAGGENVQYIAINTKEDLIHEESEFFNITLYNIGQMNCVSSRILYKNPYNVLIVDNDQPPHCPPLNEKASLYEICIPIDLTGVLNSAKGYQRMQQLPQPGWELNHFSTGLSYTGGIFTYGQTGIF